MFRKKTNHEDDRLESKSGHKLTGLESISSIFKNHPDDIEKEPIVEIPLAEEFTQMSEHDLTKPSTSKSVQLIQEVQKLEDRTIKPFVDYNEGRLFYPILSKVGEVQDNIVYLDSLVTDGILERKIYEKLIVCPLHPDTSSPPFFQVPSQYQTT